MPPNGWSVPGFAWPVGGGQALFALMIEGVRRCLGGEEGDSKEGLGQRNVWYGEKKQGIGVFVVSGETFGCWVWWGVGVCACRTG
jgi:hypothetical protein